MAKMFEILKNKDEIANLYSNVEVGNIIIVENLEFQKHNGKLDPRKDHSENGRPAVVIDKKDGYLYVLAIKGKYGYEKKDLKFVLANDSCLNKESLYQIEEIHKIKDGYYRLIGTMEKKEFYDLLCSFSWYQYGAGEKYYGNATPDDKIEEITGDIQNSILDMHDEIIKTKYIQ